jgi:hypothetical protein
MMVSWKGNAQQDLRDSQQKLHVYKNYYHKEFHRIITDIANFVSHSS